MDASFVNSAVTLYFQVIKLSGAPAKNAWKFASLWGTPDIGGRVTAHQSRNSLSNEIGELSQPGRANLRPNFVRNPMLKRA